MSNNTNPTTLSAWPCAAANAGLRRKFDLPLDRPLNP